MKALLAHRDGRIRVALAAALRREGWDVLLANSGVGAIQQWLAERPDVLLVQEDLPGLDGLAVCRRVRQQALTPVVLLAEDDSEDAVVRALEGGADDYVSHLDRTRELLARARAVLRRTRWARRSEPTGPVRAGEFILDSATCTLSQGDRVVSLSPIEYRIFDLLAANQGSVVPYAALHAYAWGYTDGGTSSLLKSHVYHLRRKTGLSARREDGLSSVSGVGYRLAEGARLGGGHPTRTKPPSRLVVNPGSPLRPAPSWRRVARWWRVRLP